MWLNSRIFSSLSFLTLLFLFNLLSLLLQPANGAEINYSERSSSSTNVCLFPFLKKLRDGAIEFFFGRHPTKSSRFPSILHSPAKYDNQLVMRFNLTTPLEESVLSEASARLFLDVWAATSEYVDIRLHVDDVAPLLGLLPESLRSTQSILDPDLGAAVRRSVTTTETLATHSTYTASLAASAPLEATDHLFFQDYQPLPVIMRWMRLLEAMFPSYVEYITIGKSYESREIPALRVGVRAPSSLDAPRKTVIVVGGLHAREWISTSTVNYLAWSFVSSFEKERIVTKLLTEFDFIFIPALNPDGVEYTWHIDRLWRKSRQQTGIQFCRGIDLDHAFGYQWNKSQVPNDACSEVYGGEGPFQAVEAKQLAEWAKNETLKRARFVGFVDLHSYSQQILFPYSYSCSVEPPNLENLEELATGIAKAIRVFNGESYTVVSACEGAAIAPKSRNQLQARMEPGGGSAIDWFYHEMGVRFSYQIKLRDTGSYGFLLPKEQIIPTGNEIFNAMKYFGDYLLGNNGIERLRVNGKNGLRKGLEDDVLIHQQLKRGQLQS